MFKKTLLLSTLWLTTSLITTSAQAEELKVHVGDFSVTTMQGQQFEFDMQALKKPIYIKFWATWCSYCTEEMPHFEQSFQAYQDKMDFVAINVGMNDSLARINKYFERHNFQVPVVFDEYGELVGQFEVKGTPLHVLINKQGKVVHRSALLTDALKTQFALLVKEAH